jgi:choline kinase
MVDKALIMAAGIGARLAGGEAAPPKCLLRFEGRSLLRRHLEILDDLGVRQVVIGVGYRAAELRAEIERVEVALEVRTVFNPCFHEGNVVTLWHLREHLDGSGPLLLMDADVLYDHRLMRRLVDSPHRDCFLLDRGFEPGDEPVKLCVRDGRIVEFRKQVDPNLAFDYQGESVGFFRIAAETAPVLRRTVERFVTGGRRDELYEEALRELVLAEPGRFAFEDVTGLPWTEIDFPEDVERARRVILPRLLGPVAG